MSCDFAGSFLLGEPLSAFACLTSDCDSSSGTRLKSEELLEWPSVFFSRRATSFAGDTRVLGIASSSMVLPRGRDEGETFKERLRKEIECKLRRRRFYCEVQRRVSRQSDMV